MLNYSEVSTISTKITKILYKLFNEIKWITHGEANFFSVYTGFCFFQSRGLIPSVRRVLIKTSFFLASSI